MKIHDTSSINNDQQVPDINSNLANYDIVQTVTCDLDDPDIQGILSKIPRFEIVNDE